MAERLPTIAVLGASGLIGGALVEALQNDGVTVLAVARRFTVAQRAAFGATAAEAPLIALDDAALTALLGGAEIVVNCLGVLQDSTTGDTTAVHLGFVERLCRVLGDGSPRLLVHLSIPGDAGTDRTAFSRSKRAGEAAIARSGLPHVILRPGFVIAPAAYGGSALLRALAALPTDLPAAEAARPFAPTALGDLVETLCHIVRQWRAGYRHWDATWEVMSAQPASVGDTIAAFRRRFGGPPPLFRLPTALLSLGARCGDIAATLGWSPPIRSTALAEMRRGVVGDPLSWQNATGIRPSTLAEAVHAVPPTVQEAWFGRLYLLKPLVIASLAVFWSLSGLIALASFGAATAILTDHGFPLPLARAITVISSLVDIGIGLAISWRRSCGPALLAGIAVSLFYMISAAVITPSLWAEPLGALVKTGPAIVLMLVAKATLAAR